MANYGDATTPLNTTYANSGYTYLEEYIHSLTPFAYAPTGTQQHVITTGLGGGGDAQVNENGGTAATSSGDGTGGTLIAHWAGASGSTNQAIVLKFDLSGIEAGSVNSATLDLTAAAAIAGTRQFRLYGLEHDGAGWDWDEASVEFANAPGLDFDGNSRTLGIDPRYTADGEPAEKGNQPLDAPSLYSLGEFTLGPLAAGQTASLDSLNLAVMLNLAAYFEGEDQAGLVTLVLQQISNSGGNAATFYSHEGDALLAPRLVVEAVVSTAAPTLSGDFDDDGDVDGADFLAWQRGDPPQGGNAGELAEWQANYGATPATGSSAAVPEPTAGWLMMIVLGLYVLGTRRGA